MSRLDDLKAISDEENDTYALDIIHARSTGVRDDVWTEGEFQVLQRFFARNTGGMELTYEAIKQLVDAATDEAQKIMMNHVEGRNA
jgi:tRNA U34 5-carboxymethylaminomethyl modifying GTPase MnmE/TrmE